MKKLVVVSILFLGSVFANSVQAQKVKTVKLEQTKGDFSVHGLTLSEGNYVFEIANNGVDHEVGFVIAPYGKTAQAHHLKAAYVKKTIKNGEASETNVVQLKKGKYVYFCPLNPTPQYTLEVN